MLLTEQSYASEDILQQALEDFPEVIAGPTTSGEHVGQLLLLRREKGVPTVEGGPASLRLDHLFVAGDAVPVLVEVKRASDTRIRREVVAQMLDYAANGVRNWTQGSLRAEFEAKAGSESEAQKRLATIGRDHDADDFWVELDANLKLGRIRMLIVADQLPPTLVRIIEFLNEQMSPAEILGVAVAQHVGGGHIVYVPRVVGGTQTAVDAKASASAKQRWARDTFMEASGNWCSEPELLLIDRLLNDVDSSTGRLAWGSGASPGVGGWYMVGGAQTGLWELYPGTGNADSHPTLQVALDRIAKNLAPERVEAVATLLEQIPAFAEPIARWRADNTKRVNGSLSQIASNPLQEEKLFEAIHDALKPI